MFVLIDLIFVLFQDHQIACLATKLEAQGPCTGHRSTIAILYCLLNTWKEKREEICLSTQIYVD